MILIADEWSGLDCRQLTMKDPTWSDVARLVGNLDASKRTMVILKRDEDNNLIIGGGRGQYVISASVDGDRFFSLVLSGKPSSPDVCLNIGGQEAEYPPDQVVDEVAAIACATEYLKSGKMDANFEWRED